MKKMSLNNLKVTSFTTTTQPDQLKGGTISDIEHSLMITNRCCATITECDFCKVHN